MPTTTKELKEVAELLAHEDDTAYYYGAYDGRFWHKGFAVVFNSDYTKTFCDLLNENGVKLPEPSQKDSMGFGVVWSWDIKHFTDADNPEPGKYADEYDDLDDDDDDY